MKPMLVLLIASIAMAADKPADTTPAPLKPKAVKALKAAYPAAVGPILEAKCFPCHAATPGKEAKLSRPRKAFDMTGGFPFNSADTLEQRLGHLRHEVETGAMPPFMYRLFKWSAKLTADDRAAILGWLDGKAPAGQGPAKK
ncbi:MAG: heme-binding domain-containing protein [Candidatus Coatesbacteria bacterium]|mgnify:CR=1 FL=1